MPTPWNQVLRESELVREPGSTGKRKSKSRLTLLAYFRSDQNAANLLSQFTAPTDSTSDFAKSQGLNNSESRLGPLQARNQQYFRHQTP
ncbi:hypothetical protein Poly59_42360 [Rubripirellula reticaptiva]|uniref:Uncharacterized protein n=1 Tax=Rubripirellula reticaptiva TaxID=2528013 RepID=A0A5C6EMP0_9BACT|nr:hypothetical protein Poly59_42360 [Rubripirellula reticaptiva]